MCCFLHNLNFSIMIHCVAFTGNALKQQGMTPLKKDDKFLKVLISVL